MAKVDPKDYGFSSGEWGKINKQVRDWITLNKELWNNLTKYEQKALKTSKDMAKNAKETSMAAEEVRNLAVEHAKVIKNMGGSTKSNLTMMGQMAAMGVKAIKFDQKSDALSKKRAKTISGIVDITGDYLANMDAIGTDEFRSLDINKQIREAIKAKLPDEEAYLRSLKAEHDVQKKLNAEITSQADLIKKPFGMLDDMVKRIPIFGDMMSKKLDLTGMGEEYADKFVESAKQAAEAQKELELNATGFATSKAGKKYGIDKGVQKKKKAELDAQSKSGKMMKKMGPYALTAAAALGAMAVSAFNFARDLGVGFSQISPGMMLFRDETKALLDEFGSVNDISTESLWTMKKASFFSGVQASDMAKIAMLQTSITGDTKEMALDKQAKFMKDIKSEGLSASKVMGDLAANADMFAEFAKDGGKNMEEAAKQAAKMGLDLSATSAVAEKLLDWESSIAAEMEASMILGKSINLDKARQLAYSGDLAAMMTEVKNQAGGEAEFAKMTVVQRKSLGEAIGLTGAQLSEFMKADEEKSKKAAEQKAKQWLMIGAIAGAVIGMIGAGLAAAVSFGALTWAGIGWTIAALAAGGAAGGIIGAAIGGSVGAAVGDVFSPAKGKTQVSTKEGGIYNLSKNDDFMAGPGIASGGGAPVVNVDNSKVEQGIERLIAIGEQGNADRISGTDTLGRKIRDSGQQY
jgi:hypothetical protein